MNKEEQKDNLFKLTKQFVYSIKREKRQLKNRLYELERLEKEILLILSNPEIAKEILKKENK